MNALSWAQPEQGPYGYYLHKCRYLQKEKKSIAMPQDSAGNFMKFETPAPAVTAPIHDSNHPHSLGADRLTHPRFCFCWVDWYSWGSWSRCKSSCHPWGTRNQRRGRWKRTSSGLWRRHLGSAMGVKCSGMIIFWRRGGRNSAGGDGVVQRGRRKRVSLNNSLVPRGGP